MAEPLAAQAGLDAEAGSNALPEKISLEMTDANNQTNDVLSRMTALGTVLM